ncbi:superoxide dismutase family protein [Microlunatus sp. GCM10028923]|uniref:superoxide dismutase family protein n=1 Tax=Microlunatus sp. GCM10028923 TaxID=3273400 RepID=UPI00360CF886
MRSSPVRRSMIIAAAALGTLLPCLTLSPAYAADGDPTAGLLDGTVTLDAGPLSDLRPEADPTDGATARLLVVRGVVASVATLEVSGLDPAAAGRSYGVHVHTGPCVAGDGEAAGPHYNHDKATGREPARVSAGTEIWLDITVDRHGRGQASTLVPFALPTAGDGIGSVVVHEHPTDHAGMAGGRLACLPLSE